MFSVQTSGHRLRFYHMQHIKFTNITIFVLFFGLALIEAVQERNWLKASIFVALGILSLRGDSKEKTN